MDSKSKRDLKELHREVEHGNGTKDQTKMWSEMISTVKNLGPTDEAALLDELEFTADLLLEDANNKYAWSYRQRVLDLLGKGCADELGFCNLILANESNRCNRLVWDQRVFALQKCLERGWTLARRSEAREAITAIMLNPENENPWRHLRLLYKNDLKSLAVNHYLQWAFVCVFTQARDSANAVTLDPKLNTVVDPKLYKKHIKHAWLLDSINKRGCLFALDLISDLLKHGYQPDKEAKDVIKELFKGYGSTFNEIVDSVLRSHRIEVFELVADFTRMAGGMEFSCLTPTVDPASILGMNPTITSSWYYHPHCCFSELRGAFFNYINVYFYPGGKRWVLSVREQANSEKENEKRRLKQVSTKFGCHKKYSDLPEQLRICCLDMDMAGYSNSFLDNRTHDLLFFVGYKNNPTVWQFRRLVIDKCDLSLQNEVEVLELLGEGSVSKSYLFWHHRRWVSEKIGIDASAKKELEFTYNILSSDPYNYHAWSHRQWVLRASGKENWSKAELKFCDEILVKDASNCFAWNQRYFVSKENPLLKKQKNKEIKYCLDKIRAEGENEMPWRYLTCLTGMKMERRKLISLINFVISYAAEQRKDNENLKDADAFVKKRVGNALKVLFTFLNHKQLEGGLTSERETIFEKVVSFLHSTNISPDGAGLAWAV